MLEIVHCHLCPLKGLCPDTIRHTQTSWRIERSFYSVPHKKPDPKDLEKMLESTKNCPLRLAVFIEGTPTSLIVPKTSEEEKKQ